MQRRKSLAAIAAIFATQLTLVSTETHARCATDDFICEKFSRLNKAKADEASARKRTAQPQPRARPASERIAATRRNPLRLEPTVVQPIKTSLNSEIAAQPAPVSITTLQAGAITDPPKDLSSLTFGADDKIEMATARCDDKELSSQSVSCAIAVHQLIQTGGTPLNCTGSLALRQLEFRKTEEGDWANEYSIALCGGRLLRRTEMFPVAVNGTPSYALRESYQMLGGDPACAAPYLRSREPLRKSYVPSSASQSNSLTCDTVTSR